MKKLIYISSIICINLIVIGGLFKVMHWPGAGAMLIVGMLLLALFVLPFACINSYKGSQNTKSLYIVGFICAFIFIITALLKIAHWPGSNFLTYTIPIPIILFLPFYYYHQRKTNEESSVNLIGVLFLMVYYTVFSAMLSINVSKGILNTFVISIEQTEKTRNAFEYLNNEAYTADANNNDKLTQIKNQSNEMIQYIHKLRTELIAQSDKISLSVADTIASDYIVNKDNYDITTHIMIGSDETTGITGEAYKLKSKINEYKTKLNHLVGNYNQSVEKINKLLSTPDEYNTHMNAVSTWEMNSFYHTTIISAVYKLTSFERDVRIAESEAIQAVKNSKL